MEKLQFQGRPLLGGNIAGSAVVSASGFNTYASFFSSIHESSGRAVSADAGNPEIYGLDLAGKILCLPQTTGSTSSGAVWQRLVLMGSAPLAVLFSKKIDSLAAGGLLVADIWTPKRIAVVDCLGEDFLYAVKTGDTISLNDCGMVHVEEGVPP